MVLYITMNEISDTYGCCKPFALMYGRANETLYEPIKCLMTRVRRGGQTT